MAKRKAGEQARRDARARALGYASDYDYRAHGYGKRKPSEPRFKGEELRRYRGHAGPNDLIARLKTGKVEDLTPFHKEKRRRQFEIVTDWGTDDESVWYISGTQADRVAQAIKDLGPGRPLVFGSPKSRRALMGAAWDRRNPT